MKTFLSDHYELQKVTLNDLTVASLCWGYDETWSISTGNQN